MARYGIDYYGRSYYGNIALSQYDVSPFVATPIDYGKIQVTWTTPSGNWTGIRLLRNSFGFPQTADDGLVLVDALKSLGATPTQFFDPVPPDAVIQPHVSLTESHATSRNMTSWTVSGNSLIVSVDDSAYIYPGTIVQFYGGNSIDGVYTVNNVTDNTISIILSSSQPTASGTSGYVLISELAQEAFYYYSIFLKVLTNTVTISSAVGNGTVITYTTATPHGLIVGSFVGVTGLSSGFNQSGVQVAAVTTNTFQVNSNVVGTATVVSGATPLAGINNTWARAGNAAGISVKDYGSQPRLYDYLPDVYKITNEQQAIEAPENPTLRSFLAIFGFYYDLLKTYATLANNRYEMSKLAGQLTPALLQEFNLTFEPEMGFKRARSLLSNITHVYQSKGSYLGVKDYVKALTGNACDIYQGKNLMLDYNNSSFEESIGNWTATNATLAFDSTQLITPYSETANPYVGIYNGILGKGKLTTTLAGTVSAACGTSNPVGYGVPVVAGTTYSLGIRVRSAATSRSVTPYIDWYDYKGTFLSTSTGTVTSSSTSAWVNVPINGVAAPTKAVFAVPRFSIASTVLNEIHYVDAVQFEASSTATWFQEARQIQIFVRANRVNLLKNPNFASSVAPWLATGTSSWEVAFDEFAPSASYTLPTGAGAGEAYSTGAGVPVTVTSATTTADYMKVSEGNAYTWSAYLTMSDDGNPTKGEQFTLNILWYDSTYTLIYEDISPTHTLNLNNVGYARYSFTSDAPTGAKWAVVKLYRPSPDAAGFGSLMDSCLFEQSPYALDYFDGTFGYADYSDLSWESSINNSPSHYYRNRGATFGSLNSNLVDFLPIGAKYAVYYGQPQ